MEKKLLNPPRGWVKNVNFVKKLCLLMLILSPFQVKSYANVNQNSQEQISLKFNNEKLSDVFNDIELACGYKFIFNYEDVELYKETATFEKKSLQYILDAITKDKPVTYKIQTQSGLVIISSTQKKDVKMHFVVGKVIDSEKNPLPGVNIEVNGYASRAVSNGDGNYEIQVPENTNSILLFSFVGMKPKEMKIKSSFDGNKLDPMVLIEDSRMVKDVVVTGYQTLDKSKIAGAVSVINSKDLYLNGINTLEQALQGTLPGLVVTNTSGLVGVRQTTRVRGTSTLTGSEDPVWVVDDIIQEDPLPFDKQTFNSIGQVNSSNFDYIKNYVGNSISWLSPNDIESVTVLKDASATAIYGVKAANGVIVIKTKRGKVGAPAISYSLGMNYGERVNYSRLGMMNSKERVAVSREIFNRGLIASWTENDIGYAGAMNQYLNKEITYDELNKEIAKLETTNTDWFKILYRNPFSYNNSASLSGGTEKVRYIASIGYNSTNGTAIGNDSKSYSARIGLNMDVTKKLKIDFNLAGSNTSTDGFYIISPYTYASKTNRVIQAYDDDGDLSYYKNSDGFLYNVINERNQSGNNNKVLALNSSLNAIYDLTPNIKLQSLFSINIESSLGYSYATEKSEYIAKIRNYDYGEYKPTDDGYKNSILPRGGEYNSDNNRTNTWNWRNTISYDKVFNKVHAVTAMLGLDMASTKYYGFSSTEYGYLKDRGESFATVPVTYGTLSTNANPLYSSSNTYHFSRSITDRLTNTMGAYLTMVYAYDNRYVVNFSVRGDASNRFGKNTNDNFNPVWAGGLRWNAGHEKWFESNSVISDLSLRASLGFQRNMASNYSPDLIVKIPSGTSSDVTDSNTGEDLLTINSLPYTDLRWEKTLSTNYGMDLSLFDNKVRMSVDAYWKKGTDMIVDFSVPEEYGIDTMPVNSGSMDNHGYEITLGLTPVRTRNFTWNFSMNAAKNINKITETGIENPTWYSAVSGSMHKTGYSSSGFWAFRYKGIDQTTGYPIIDLSIEDGKDPQSDPTAYMKYVGSMDPDFTGGISSSFRYKNLTLNASFFFQLGGKKFLTSAFTSTTLPSEYENLPAELNARWEPGDKNAKFPGLPDSNVKNILVPGTTQSYTNYYEMYNYSTARVVSASTLRCNDISLSYMFPETIAKKLFCKNLMLSGSVSQPFAIVSKDFKGRDAEVSTGQQPRTRSYSFNLNITF